MKDAMTEVESDSGERARVRALHSLDLMGTAPEERFDRITRIARELFDVPVAAVNLLDERELFVKSPSVHGPRTMDRSDTFCDATISSPGLLVVEDATADPRFASKPDVAGGRGVRFYAGRP
jgi:GAF domain-containing protein